MRQSTRGYWTVQRRCPRLSLWQSVPCITDHHAVKGPGEGSLKWRAAPCLGRHTHTQQADHMCNARDHTDTPTAQCNQSSSSSSTPTTDTGPVLLKAPKAWPALHVTLYPHTAWRAARVNGSFIQNTRQLGAHAGECGYCCSILTVCEATPSTLSDGVAWRCCCRHV